MTIQVGIWGLTREELAGERIGNDRGRYELCPTFRSTKWWFYFWKTVAYFPGNRFFAFDLRFRYLRGVNYGWTTSLDSIHNLNPNYQQFISTQTYRNYRMDLNDFSLEGVLSLHKLREKTGVLLYGFGGLGIVDYRVKADYLNGQVLIIIQFK